MSLNETPGSNRGLNHARMAATALALCGALVVVAALAWFVTRLWEVGRSDSAAPAEVTGAAALLLVGCGFGLLLWGAAWALRRLDDLLDTLRQASPAGAEMRQADDAEQEQTRLLAQLIDLTREVRDIALLGEQDRAARLAAEGEALVQRLTAEVAALLREHNWAEARARVRRAHERFPSLPNWRVLEEQVEHVRSAAEARDLEAATREVAELLSLGAADRATEVVRHFQERHPACAQAGELVRRVAAARERTTAEERARLMSRAQEATNRRDWSEALHVVESLLERYPDSPEAHDLRAQLPTLRTNVEVQARHQMELEIRDLIKAQRFTEALELAQRLIGRYPDSPQAAVLREQLSRLEQRAAEAR